jgi:hypothetical protein
MFTPKYQATVKRWLDDVRERLDPALGMLPHSAVAGTGDVQIGTRGLTAALQGRMLYEVDPDFARQQYRKMREHFAAEHLGILPGILEYRKGASGSGDVDSGPLVFGFSGSASVVAIAAARLHGDRQLAEPLMVGAHAVGVPTGWGDSRRYGFGLLPVGEAFFVWSKTTRPWVGPPPEARPWEPVMIPGWRFVWHGLSALVLLLLGSGELVAFVRRRRSER